MREKINKLAQHITKRNQDFTEKDPEYYVFADILTDEEADVLLAMERRKEETVETIASRIGKNYTETFDLLMKLTDIGAIEMKPQGDGTDRFELLIYLPGIFELMMLNREQAKAHPEIARAFEEYSRASVEPVTQIMPMGNGALRVIPVESAIKSVTRKAPYEEISHWLTKYQNH
ncbi:MAG: pyridine nucleotide-disulfide oxidoreductase, partial [Lachnospiraceae bacterium]